MLRTTRRPPDTLSLSHAYRVERGVVVPDRLAPPGADLRKQAVSGLGGSPTDHGFDLQGPAPTAASQHFAPQDRSNGAKEPGPKFADSILDGNGTPCGVCRLWDYGSGSRGICRVTSVPPRSTVTG